MTSQTNFSFFLHLQMSESKDNDYMMFSLIKIIWLIFESKTLFLLLYLFLKVTSAQSLWFVSVDLIHPPTGHYKIIKQ